MNVDAWLSMDQDEKEAYLNEPREDFEREPDDPDDDEDDAPGNFDDEYAGIPWPGHECIADGIGSAKP